MCVEWLAIWRSLNIINTSQQYIYKAAAMRKYLLKLLQSRQGQKSRQGGFITVEVGFAILAAAAMMAGIVKTNLVAAEAEMAMSQGESLALVSKAAETLIFDHYDTYQAGMPVTRNGVTLAFGTAPGQSMTPTMDNLRDMALGITPGSNFGTFKTLSDATFITTIQRIPAGCELSPGGSSCNITGLTCMDKPLKDFGAPAGEYDGVGAGHMIGKIGANGGVALIGSEATVTGFGGAWTAPNPFAGTPAGIVCARFGFGAAGFGKFLRVNDSRDPNFQNNVTIGGNVIVTTGTVGTGTGSTGCRLGEIMNSGDFISRSATCIKRAWVDGANGEIGVADAAGIARAQLKDTGEILSKDAAGNVKAGFTYTGTASNAIADNLLNNAGTGGVRANGETFGNSIVISTASVPGAACPTNNAMVWGSAGTSLKLLKCVANVWTATGTSVGTIGGACSINGQLGETTFGESIICVNNIWMTTVSRMGRWAVAYTAPVVHGSVIGKPSCGSGIPLVISIPQGIDATNLFVSFKADDNGPSWTIVMPDGDNNGTSSSATAQAGCWFS